MIEARLSRPKISTIHSDFQLPISIGVSSKSCSMIADLLISMLKTTRSSKVLTPKALEVNDNQVVNGGGGR